MMFIISELALYIVYSMITLITTVDKTIVIIKLLTNSNKITSFLINIILCFTHLFNILS